ncbi:MAG TPA: hypothetical protein EYQ31_10015, partial [Candidatus Handelsmanbacteria bacterium]|nr:hypothetical protein [Candidatus Handelsmanbacteria bacterium]
ILQKIVGSKHQREVKRMWPVVNNINKIEEGLQRESLDTVLEKVAHWKKHLARYLPLETATKREIQLMEANPTSREAIADIMQLPPENFGIGTMNGATVDAQAHAYNDLLFHTYDQIASLGFRALIVLCGHYPLQLYTDYTSAVFMRRSQMRVFAATEATFVADMVEELGARVGDHAAKWETSLLMALRPGLTDLSQLPPMGEEVVGVSGEDPREANLGFGRRAVAAIVRRMKEKGDELLAGRKS